MGKSLEVPVTSPDTYPSVAVEKCMQQRDLVTLQQFTRLVTCCSRNAHILSPTCASRMQFFGSPLFWTFKPSEMSPPISQECWDDNKRLYREMIEDSASRSREDAISPESTQIHRRITPSSQGLRQGARSRHAMNQLPSRAPVEQLRSTAPASRAPEVLMAFPATNTGYIDPTQPAGQLTYHINGHTFSKPRPEYIFIHMPTLSPPRDPTRTIPLLQLARPELSYVEFSCGCHNLGICTHYQILFDRSKMPDGMICDDCDKDRMSGRIPQTTIKGKRKCPRHQDDSGLEKNHTRSRPEDFLPTEDQAERYQELMERSKTGRWEGVERSLDRMSGRRIAEPVSRRRERTETRRPVHPAEAPSWMPTATCRSVPGPGPGPRHVPETNMWRGNIGPQSDGMQAQAEPTMLPPPTWAAHAQPPAPMPAQLENQSFFQPFEQWTDLNRRPFRLDTSSELMSDDFDDSGMAWTQQSGMGVTESDVGEGSRGEDARRGGVIFADLRSIENGTPYNFDITQFLQCSGLGEK